jgi:hypothetical protein
MTPLTAPVFLVANFGEGLKDVWQVSGFLKRLPAETGYEKLF